MMFDDHDVTDDGYMDANWVRQTNNDPAKLVIGGALYIYWLFQGCGNDPDGPESLRNPVQFFLRLRRARRGRYRPDYSTALKEV